MSTIQHPTGRVYDGAQVLEIDVLSDHTGECGLRDVVATFNDASRRIKGRVELVVFPADSIGESVLQAYDAGRYATL